MAFSKKTIGNDIIELDTIPSTNNYAADLLRTTNVQNGTVILAHEQTAGRGQRGKDWHSSSGQDLTFSIVLYPEALPAVKQFYLSRVVALGIFDHLKTLVNTDVSIKWPNDIFVDDKKICGILIENELNSSEVSQSIVGIGLNVAFAEASVDFIHTSLQFEMHGELEKMDLLQGMLAAINKRYQELRSGKFVRLARDHANALYLKGRWTAFDLRGDVVRARILDVEEDGRLTIETEAGKVVSEGLGKLRHILYGTDILK